MLGVAAFLLFGRDSAAGVRQLGRWYARALNVKRELMGELARAADLPVEAGSAGGSLRAALLGLGPAERVRPGIPAAVRVPPTASAPAAVDFWPTTAGSPVTNWSATYFAAPPERQERP